MHNLVPVSKISGLSRTKRSKAQALFDKYPCVFAENDFNLGCDVDATHRIDTCDSYPIRLRPIRRSKDSKETFKNKIQKLIDRDMLVPSRSPWASPVIIVKKK